MRYFKDVNGDKYTGEIKSNGLWSFRCNDTGDWFLADSIKSAGMKEISFNEFAGIA